MKTEINLQDLLSQMTLEEKIGQLFQLIPSFYSDEGQDEITGPLNEMGITENQVWQAGSVLGTTSASQVIEIQKKYLEKSRLGIPLMFMADIIHGYRTIFPIPLAIGSSWDEKSAEEAAHISAIEAAVSGTQVTFSPMVDLVRDPRWGRVLETTSEDSYLNSIFAKAFVRGYQGNLTGKYDIAACVKHFAAYGAAEAGRDYNTVDMSDRTLREYYLPAYKAAIEAGCKMVMTSFNTVHGVPSTGNQYLIKNILRDEWGFEGIVISDWGAVDELMTHGVAENGKEAAEKAIGATVDIEMMSSHYVNHLLQSINEGRVSEEEINKCVLRILKFKQSLGLFENPYKAASIEKERELIGCQLHREVARRVAQKSIVLLKNEGVLPLLPDQKVAIVGPMADSGDILGAWSWQGKTEEAITLLEGIREKVANSKIVAIKGCEINGMSLDRQAVEKVIEEADVIILALGESSDMSGEGNSRAFIKLPEIQEKLAQIVMQKGKPVVTVLFNGRPLEITELAGNTDALLEAWYPGSEGGRAIADILYGDINPSAKLTMSFPYTVGQVPVYYNHYNTGRPKKQEGRQGYCSEFIDIPNKPLYPFGYGLSYTEFEYSNLILDKKTLSKETQLEATITIKNIGPVAGIEIVQMYIRDKVGSTVRPVKELKGFKRVEVQPGEVQEVKFVITEEMLRYHTLTGRYESEVGDFELMIGKSSEEFLTTTFELIN